MSLSVDIQHLGNVAVLKLTGDLTTGNETILQQAAEPLAERGPARVVLDLSGVALITSAGLGRLVYLAARVNHQQGRLVLANVSPFVAGVLASTRLDRFFEVCPDLNAAVSRAAQPPPPPAP